jgi:hypothetical protein
MNPIHALVRLIDTMHTPQGAIAVEGFYDAVRPLTEPEQDQIAEIPFDEADYKAELGVDALFGEPGYSTYERAWIRPTLEFAGQRPCQNQLPAGAGPGSRADPETAHHPYRKTYTTRCESGA